MSQTTVRISRASHRLLKAFAREDELTLTEELEQILQEAKKRRFHERARQAYARLREDEEAWADYQQEIRSVEGTLTDGLEEAPYVDEC